jgi:hypothetical protein
MSEGTDNVNSKVNKIISDSSSELSSEFQQLEKSLDEQGKKQQSILKEIVDKTNDSIDVNTGQFETNIKLQLEDQKTRSDDSLVELKDSINGQFEGFREYANKLVEEEEEKLVNDLATTMANVSDITGSHSAALDAVISQVNSVANDSTSKAIDLIKERDEIVKGELVESLTMNQEKLSSALTSLQSEFQESIGNQIEQVFMGVHVTKQEINEIIKDTLSRLESNLNRLTEGLDENFTKEVGKTQDLIHAYEGKVLETNKNIQLAYEEQMNAILDRHLKLTVDNVDMLFKGLNQNKDEILSQITNLSEDQQKLVSHALNQLEEQVKMSKSNIIEFNGYLKDSIQTTIDDNKTTTETIIKQLQNETAETFNQFLTQLKSNRSTTKSDTSRQLKDLQKEANTQFSEYTKATKTKIGETKGVLEKYKASLKELEGE